MEYAPTRLQAAVWLVFVRPPRWLEVAQAIVDSGPDVFAADPVLLPAGQDTPFMLPRCVLTTLDKCWTVLVSAERLDLIRESDDGKPPVEPTSAGAEAISLLAPVWTALHAAPEMVRGLRFGLVLDYAISADDPVLVLRQRFLRSSHAEAQQQLQLHALHRVTVASLQLNRWLRCSACRADGETSQSLSARVDLNTPPDLPMAADTPALARFIETAYGEAGRLMEALFGSSEPSGEVF